MPANMTSNCALDKGEGVLPGRAALPTGRAKTIVAVPAIEFSGTVATAARHLHKNDAVGSDTSLLRLADGRSLQEVDDLGATPATICPFRSDPGIEPVKMIDGGEQFLGGR